jgi:hypothetical protein
MKIGLDLSRWLVGSILALFLLLCSANAQPAAQQIQDRFDGAKAAIVKIRVEGTGPDDKSKKKEGSGFFIYSDENRSFS